MWYRNTRRPFCPHTPAAVGVAAVLNDENLSLFAEIDVWKLFSEPILAQGPRSQD